MNVSKGSPRVEIESTQSGVEAGQRLPRRGLLAAGIGGAAVSLLPFLTGRASASATSTTEAATTTTLPPKRPTDDDTSLIAVAQQAELAAVDLYSDAINGVKGWTDAQATVMTTIRQAHLAYANSVAGLIGKAAPQSASEDLYRSLKNDFIGSAEDVLQAAATLESALVATHLEILGKLQGTNGAALVASIVTAEARHGTVLLDLAGVTDDGELLVENEQDSLLANG